MPARQEDERAVGLEDGIIFIYFSLVNQYAGDTAPARQKAECRCRHAVSARPPYPVEKIIAQIFYNCKEWKRWQQRGDLRLVIGEVGLWEAGLYCRLAGFLDQYYYI